MGLTVKLNPSTAQPAVAFFDRANNQVKYRYCSSAVSSCGTAANWGFVGLGIVDALAGVSGLSAAATDGLLQASLTFASTGQPWIVWPTGAGATAANLLYSYVSTATSVFTTGAALSSARNASITTPVAATAANFAAGGWMPSSVRSILGSLHTVYVGPGNHLYVTSCGD
jgi:hypothetical protein